MTYLASKVNKLIKRYFFFITLTLFVGLNSLLKQRLTKIRSVHCIWSTQYFEGRIEKRKGNGMCDNCILLR